MLYLVFLLIFPFHSAPAKSPASLSQIRALYVKATESEKSCKELLTILKPYNETNNPLFYGYKAGATMLMAKHTINPISKLSWFNKGKKMLETAIKTDNKDVELRCLRFGIQSNIPSFLGYKQEIPLDKKFILQSFPHVKDEVLRSNIVSFLTKWGDLSPAEKSLLK